METAHDRLAGQKIDRFSALSDGAFAVAMTLLVADLGTPVDNAIHSVQRLLRTLGAMGTGHRALRAAGEFAAEP